MVTVLPRVSYAQTGQDIFANYLLERRDKRLGQRRRPGVYVDVGACYPVKVSNTYFFYERGWRGLCIDANPASREPFVAARPRDTFVTCAISAETGLKPFHTFDNPQWNSFSEERLKTMTRLGHYTGTIEVATRRLSDVIDENLPDVEIDMLTMDIEGHELAALGTLDLSRHRPYLFLLESVRSPLQAGEDPAIQVLTNAGYTLRSHTGHDAFLTLD
jgi:FkbM family methyltransferase